MDPIEGETSDNNLHVSSSEEQLAAWTIGGEGRDNTDPQQLQEAMNKLEELMCLYRCAIMEVETKFKVLNTRFSLERDRNPISSITTRLKSYDSIYEKISRAGIEPGLDSLQANMHDIAGVRVVCSFEDDVYLLADCLERQDDITILRRKDYIENPKPNGYRSLHLIVEVPIFLPDSTQKMQVEVQLRTIAMEFWASLEHKIRYKKDIDPELLKATSDALLQCAQLSSKLDAKMQTVRHMIDGFQFLSDMEQDPQHEAESANAKAKA